MVDVPVGQVALGQIVLGVVPVQVEPRRQEIGRRVAPLGFPLHGGDVVLDGVHQFVDVVMVAQNLVHVVSHQLNGQVAGNPAHPHQAGVHGGVPQQMLVNELLRQAEAQRHVLVQMQPHPDAGVQIVVHQTDNPLQVPAAHAAEGVHDGELIGQNGVDLVQNPQNVPVAVAHDVDGIDGQFVAPGLDLPGKIHALLDVVVVGGDADHLDALARIFAQLGNVVVGAHRHTGIHGVAGIVRQQAVELLDGVADGHVGVILFHIAQKTHLDNVGAGTGQGADDLPRRGKAPAPVVHIAAVAQRAVQQFHVGHVSSPYSNG